MKRAILRLTILGLLSSCATGANASTLDDLYVSLRPENLRTQSGATTFAGGDDPYFFYEIVNRSANTLTVPLTNYFGNSFYLAGVEQTWIERLGPDATIPMPGAARKGTWYAAGGQIMAFPGPTTFLPDEGITRYTQLYNTALFAPGQYRYRIEYEDLSSNVLADIAIDLTFINGPTSVPEPASLSLLLLSVCGLIVWRCCAALKTTQPQTEGT